MEKVEKHAHTFFEPWKNGRVCHAAEKIGAHLIKQIEYVNGQVAEPASIVAAPWGTLGTQNKLCTTLKAGSSASKKHRPQRLA